MATEGRGDMRPQRARIMMEVVGRITARIAGTNKGGIHTILALVVMVLSKIS